MIIFLRDVKDKYNVVLSQSRYLQNVDLKIYWPGDLSGGNLVSPLHLSTVTVNPAGADITCVQIEGIILELFLRVAEGLSFCNPMKIIPGNTTCFCSES